MHIFTGEWIGGWVWAGEVSFKPQLKVTSGKLACNHQNIYCQISSIRLTKSQHLNVSHLVLQLSLPNPLNQAFSWEWKFGWSRADMWCSNYIRVINNFIAYYDAPYIRGLKVLEPSNPIPSYLVSQLQKHTIRHVTDCKVNTLKRFQPKSARSTPVKKILHMINFSLPYMIDSLEFWNILQKLV